MLVSILHRATGDGMALVGLAVLVWWLGAIASGPEAYETFAGVMTSPLGYVVLVGLTWAFFTHLMSGLRHFVLDIGAGYELDTNRFWSVASPFIAIILTVAFWAFVLRGNAMGNGTSIGRVRGLGSAHDGAHHWLVHRFTAISNLVLMSWLLISFLLMGDFSYGSVSSWLAQPVSATAMILLVISLFWHARLGLQVLIEDYVHNSGSKFALLTALNIAVIGGGAFSIFSVAAHAFGGQA